MEESVRPIRFALLCDRASLASWEHRALGAVLAQAQASLALVIRFEAPAPKAAGAAGRSSQLLWNSYVRWGYRPSALRPAPEPSWPRHVPLLACAVPRPGAGPPLTDAALATISACRLDFVLSFARGPLIGPLLRLPRLGVWAFRFGPPARAFAPPVGFWEVFCRAPTTTAALCRLAEVGPAAVLRYGVLRTAPYSPSDAADRLYAECANWPAEVCRQLAAGADPARPDPRPLPAASDFWPPANAAMLAFLGRLAQDKLRHLYNTFLRADQWNIGVVNRPIRNFLRPDALRGVPVDAPPLPNRHVFYADCFARQEDSGTVVYFERYDYRARRGTVARLHYPWLPGDVPADVLRFPFHLSYPFLFGPYCLPEAWVTNGIRLYDLRAPVTDPAAGRVLLAVPGIDPTLLAHGGRYWLFYTRADRDPMLNLVIAYADALAGPWHEHPQNPVKTDIRGARPAGPFFEEAGRLYRPAQDCARDYGHGITLHEVLTLTPTEYEEREVATLTSFHPDYPDGMHTVAAIGPTHTLVDFKRRRFIPVATLSALWRPVSEIIYGEKGRRKPPVIQPALPAQPAAAINAANEWAA